MCRRLFLSQAAFGFVVAPRVAYAQRRRSPFRIGFLSSVPKHGLTPRLAQALVARGWAEGPDFIIEPRGSGLDFQRSVAMARELVAQNIDVIVTVGTWHAVAAKQATRTTPIVMMTSGFPVLAGLAQSFARPGGNVTGLSVYEGSGLFAKYIQLLRELVPKLRRLGILWDHAPPGYEEMNEATRKEMQASLEELRRVASEANMTHHLWMVRSASDLKGALAAAARLPLDALFVTGGTIHAPNRAEIADFVTRRRLPVLNDFPLGVFPAAGVVCYSIDLSEVAARTAHFLERIRDGSKPSDLPIELPAKFDLAINLKTAKAIGLTIPADLLLRAQTVIE
jgi:putative tryptophan/tyrosine transport system substrate-binding protein